LRSPADYVPEQRYRFLDPFHRAHRRVLVLDAEHAVVALRGERRDEILPPRFIAAVAERDVAPRTMAEITPGVVSITPLTPAMRGSIRVSFACT
jgi:hypothetical protein